MAQLNFNAAEVQPLDSFEAIPARVQEFHEIFGKLVTAFMKRFVAAEK